MLELLLKIIDKLKELLELRDKRAEKIFEKFIEPIYKDTQLIHQDYLETFRELATHLPVPNSEQEVVQAACKKALEFLMPRSLKHEVARETLRAIAEVQREVPNNLRPFFTALNEYLNPPWFVVESHYGEWIEILKAASQNLDWVDSDDLKDACLAMVQETQEAWRKLSQIYAEMKIKVVSL